MDENVKNQIQELRRRFFSMRNGVVGDQMRRQGADYKVNFGLNMPQILEITADYAPDAELAQALWDARSTRECMIASILLMPRQAMSRECAMSRIKEAPTVECIDILCHRLLRHLDFADELVDGLLAEDVADELSRYAGLRLMSHLLTADNAERYHALARAEARSGRSTAMVGRMIEVQIEDSFLAADLEP